MKRQFNWGKERTMYALKHTAMEMLEQSGLHPHVGMLYTGHDSIEAYETYMKSRGTKRPEDISERFAVNF